VVSRNRNLNGQLYEIADELVRHGIPLEQARREFERQFIVAALRSHDGNLSQSAQSIGVHRNTLRNKVCSLGIAGKEYARRLSRRRRRS
jgi:DNA-binding NtrC family response regulator